MREGDGMPTALDILSNTVSVPGDGGSPLQLWQTAIREAIVEEMTRDERVFVMGEDIRSGVGGNVLSGLDRQFGEKRVVEVPTVPQAAVGMAVGAALAGLRPVFEFRRFDYAVLALDHILHTAAKVHAMSGKALHCPLVLRGPHGASMQAGAQSSQDFSALYAQIPGLKVVAPFLAGDAKALLKAAIRDENPVIFLEHERLYQEMHPIVGEQTEPSIGQARLHRTGKDVTLVSFGAAMKASIEAAEIAAKSGIDVELIDLRSLRPLDHATILASLRKTTRLVTVEDGWPGLGIGAEVIAETVTHGFDWLDAPPVRVTGQDIAMPYAAHLEVLALPSAATILRAIRMATGQG